MDVASIISLWIKCDDGVVLQHTSLRDTALQIIEYQTYYESLEEEVCACDSKEDILDSGLCIHDENYLKDKNDHENTVRDKLMVKVGNSIDKKSHYSAWVITFQR
jgi:hypothetical protein